VNNLAQIDYDKCTGCGNCVDNCPTGCLKRLIAPAHSQDIEAEE
jgi:formate hydrogenlyase subunit 6/NADH:ubiquinone oxidoreductase subunit I